jgi:hypothetical protein
MAHNFLCLGGIKHYSPQFGATHLQREGHSHSLPLEMHSVPPSSQRSVQIYFLITSFNDGVTCKH